MIKKLLFAMAFTGLSAFSAVQADSEFLDDRFYVAPFGTYVHTGGERNASDGWGGGMAIGKIIDEYFNVEVKGYWQNFGGRLHTGAGYQADLTGGTVDLQYFFLGDEDGDGFRDAFSPYVVAAVGGQNTSMRALGDSTSAASFVFETGLGATYEVLDNFLLRADVRYRLDTSPSNDKTIEAFTRGASVFNDMLVNVGFVIPFGDKPVKAAVAAPAAPDCSTRDSDHDGVNDCDDKCPNTAAGMKVDEFGCPIRIELKGVNFKYDSDELTDTAKTILDKVAVDLGAYPVKKNIEVRGHASSEGSSAYNLRLSQRRSQSVANYLKQRGVTNRLIAKGYGEDYPIADNSTEAGRAKNRRVELVWTGE